MEKKLEVKNLQISFRTASGKVQAVRDISFDLFEGETLAIVGESGSGKSVTTRAIMGILAGNAILENGEILYDGEDLLKFSETDFQEIRGDKIAMIFQDPMSSLNPIVKVGKQLTEAMLLKSKANRKNGKRDFYDMLKKLNAAVNESGKAGDFAELSEKFVSVQKRATWEEEVYQQAKKNADEANERVKELLVAFEKRDEKTISSKCAGIYKYASKCQNRFFGLFGEEKYLTALSALKKEGDKKPALDELHACFQKCLEFPEPDFSAIAYYELFSGSSADTGDIAALNAKAGEASREFFAAFQAAAKTGVEYSARRHGESKKQLIPELEKALDVLSGEWKKNVMHTLVKELTAKVKECIDPLALKKESAEHTLGTILQSCCDKYFAAAVCAERERIKERAKTAVNDLISLYRQITTADFDSQTEAAKLVAYLKKKASLSSARMTKTAAKRRAIRLLNEVGIPEPEKRYTQYPFQLSGGQRQRIVIAIALSADPDILICDEPTTALDVTIQAQILDLIKKVKKERNLSVIFITHDLGVVANIADRIAVMYAGKILEYGTSEEVFYQPAHPYTWALLSSVPDMESSGRLETIHGTPPNMIYPPKGDAFADRNPYALEIDFKEQAPMFRITDTHYAATWLLHPLAPKVEMPAAVTERIKRMKKETDRGR